MILNIENNNSNSANIKSINSNAFYGNKNLFHNLAFLIFGNCLL